MKRQPSAPWSGWPAVTGMSAAVMPTRSTVSACAGMAVAAAMPSARSALPNAAMPASLVFASRQASGRVDDVQRVDGQRAARAARTSTAPEWRELRRDDLLVGHVGVLDAEVACEAAHAGDEIARDRRVVEWQIARHQLGDQAGLLGREQLSTDRGRARDIGPHRGVG